MSLNFTQGKSFGARGIQNEIIVIYIKALSAKLVNNFTKIVNNFSRNFQQFLKPRQNLPIKKRGVRFSGTALRMAI